MRNALTAVKIKNAGDGKLQDGGGLILVKKGDAGKWVFRYSHLGKRREMGLGPWPDLSLSDARRERDRWARELAAGVDPIDMRKAAQAEAVALRDQDDPTFADLVTMVFEARRDQLRGGGTRGRWRSPLDLHVIPKIGRRRVSQLHQSHIRDALKPIWRTKYPTAEKAMQRIAIVLREGQRMGFPADPQIADAAKAMLGVVKHRPQHIAATPWQDIPDLYQRLGDGTLSGACLRLMILTAVRLDAAAGATVGERGGDVWTVPADRIKGMEGAVTDFRVPLVADAVGIFEEAEAVGSAFLFPGARGKSPITSRALEKRLDHIGETGRPHGFRTSFRTWAQDTGQPWDVAETALGHAIGGKVERTYARSDLLDRRRAVMERWAAHVTGAGAKVVRIGS